MPDTTPLLSNGDSAQRVDIVFVAEGYQTSERAKFLIDAGVMLNYMTSISSKFALLNAPISTYAKYLNASALFVASNQSGMDMPNKGVAVDTAFGASQHLADGRLVYGDQGKVVSAVNQAYAANAHELVIGLVNSTIYGGAGGDVAWATAGNSSSAEVLLHEIGHSFAGLEDEYADSSLVASYPLSNLKSVHVAASSVNVPWAAWLGYTDSLGVVGAYEGGYYRTNGVWRATQDSKMLYLNRPFSAPQKEAFVLAFYANIGDYLTLQTAIPGICKAVVPDSTLLSFAWSQGAQTVSGSYANYFDAYGTASYLTGAAVTVKTVDASGLVRTYLDATRQTETLSLAPVAVVEFSGSTLTLSQNGAVVRCGPQDSSILLGPGAANLYIDGGAGNDTLQVAGLSRDFTLVTLPSGASILQNSGIDWLALFNIEAIKFNDKSQVINASNKTMLVNMLGSETLQGGSGLDIALYNNKASNYTVTATIKNNLSVFSVKGNIGDEGADTLTNIERIQFSDRTVALDINGIAGQAYRVYQAAFNRTPDNGGLKYWIGLMDGGYTLAGVASGFIASAEFKTLYGSNPTNELFVSKLYDNVLHRTPDISGYNYWVGLLNTKKIDNISALINFSESPENQAGVIGVIQNGIDLLN
jgi:hypothetical protein